jgi:hypothetical protein
MNKSMKWTQKEGNKKSLSDFNKGEWFIDSSSDLGFKLKNAKINDTTKVEFECVIFSSESLLPRHSVENGEIQLTPVDVEIITSEKV